VNHTYTSLDVASAHEMIMTRTAIGAATVLAAAITAALNVHTAMMDVCCAVTSNMQRGNIDAAYALSMATVVESVIPKRTSVQSNSWLSLGFTISCITIRT
jgi:hypothetical protein